MKHETIRDRPRRCAERWRVEGDGGSCSRPLWNNQLGREGKSSRSSKELGYQANEIARSMTTGRSGIIGVIVGDIENPYFGLAVRGITDAARAEGFDVILANSGEEIEKERDAVRVLMGKRVDGLIITSAKTSETHHLLSLQKTGRPVVLLDRAVSGLSVDTAVTDDHLAASAATRRLVEFGHRRIAYISAVSSSEVVFRSRAQIDTSTVLDRIDGFLDVARQAGIEAPERYIRLGATDPFMTRKIVTDLLALSDRPSAILASDNIIALEVFKTIRALRLQFPEDVSLIAFHDADWTSVTTPAVTVIAQPIYDLGRESARMLIERVRGAVHAPRRFVLKSTLINRQSVSTPLETKTV